ncbi:hypothetical protein [Flavobacterium sp. C3NV]|uniref:hypothetical protein n=1 Tax=Flavobacterium sp. C3NV TaxID=3393358 RepID=UPI00398FE3FE
MFLKFYTSDYIQSGVFILKIRKDSYKKEWRHGKISLENNLAEIIAKLELIAVEEKQWKETGDGIELKKALTRMRSRINRNAFCKK